MISLVQASTATPENKFSTTELVASMMHKFSPELINSICSLGVDNRYSTMNNYADFLAGAPMNQTSSTTELGVNATRRCIEEWGGDPSQIGLLIAATNTPDQSTPVVWRSSSARSPRLMLLATRAGRNAPSQSETRCYTSSAPLLDSAVASADSAIKRSAPGKPCAPASVTRLRALSVSTRKTWSVGSVLRNTNVAPRLATCTWGCYTPSRTSNTAFVTATRPLPAPR